MWPSAVRSLGCVVLVSLSLGCLERELRPLTPCTLSVGVQTIETEALPNIDLLFVVDNSSSMTQEQDALAREIPRLVGILASGDVDFDATTGAAVTGKDFVPVQSLHVGVVSSDMGAGGQITCPGVGQNGLLQNGGQLCDATQGSFFTFEAAANTPASAIAEQVACAARLGDEGCGWEQSMLAMLTSLSPANGKAVRGHADGANAGFLRDDSLLVVILLTDEDDCSATDPELFNQNSSLFSSAEPRDHVNVRCAFHEEYLMPVSEIVDGLRGLRNDPRRLVFAAITGVPEDLVNNPDAIRYNNILSDPRLALTINPAPTAPGYVELTPSCASVPGQPVAYPPPRIVQIARDLELAGSTAIVQSICQADFRPAISSVVERIRPFFGSCLPRPLEPDSSGRVSCSVVEILPREGDVTRCEQIADRGRAFRFVENGREVCEVAQTTDAPKGWYYDTSAAVAEACGATPQRISFTEDARPIDGSTVRLECILPVEDRAGIGTACRSDSDCDGSGLTGLSCDPVALTCRQACETDAQCLAGMVCAEGQCLNPTCL